jgi:hypothetical protein
MLIESVFPDNGKVIWIVAFNKATKAQPILRPMRNPTTKLPAKGNREITPTIQSKADVASPRPLAIASYNAP